MLRQLRVAPEPDARPFPSIATSNAEPRALILHPLSCHRPRACDRAVAFRQGQSCRNSLGQQTHGAARHSTGCTFWCSSACRDSTRTRAVPRRKRRTHHGFLWANRDVHCTAVRATEISCLIFRRSIGRTNIQMPMSYARRSAQPLFIVRSVRERLGGSDGASREAPPMQAAILASSGAASSTRNRP